MKQYEKSITLKSAWLTLIREYDVILLIFIPIILVSFVTTQVIMKKHYYSEATYYRYEGFDNTSYASVKQSVGDDQLPSIVNELAEAGVKHSNNNPITASELSSGITFNGFESGGYLTFSFVTTERAIAEPTMTVVLQHSYNYLKNYDRFKGLSIAKQAQPAKRDGKNMKYFLIISAAGLGVALVAAFVYEVINDRVYNVADMEAFECAAIEVKVPKEKKEKKNVSKEK